VEKLSLPLLFAAALLAQPPHQFVFLPPSSLTGNSGAPYSADEVHERGKPDSPGKLERTEVDRIYRDGEGRIRREMPVSHSNLHVVQIEDPVGGWMIVLDPQAKVAHRVKVARNHVYPLSKSTSPSRPLGSDQSLGTRMIEGFQANGTRSVMQMDAGPSITDLWHIPELSVLVETKQTLPRSGVFIVRLEHLQRGDPDPALFEIPQDYKIADETARFSIAISPDGR